MFCTKKPLIIPYKFFEKNFKNYFSPNDILNETVEIQSLIQALLLDYPKYKVNFLLQIEYILKGENNLTLEREIFHIRTSNVVVSKAKTSKNLERIIHNH